MPVIFKDSKDQSFVDVGNMRITLIPRSWSGRPGLRFQAYRDSEKNDFLHKGAEVPVPNKRTSLELITAIVQLLEQI